jgi:hypothetical protein
VPLAIGRYAIQGTYTLPASYASGGEILTNAILKAKFGINKIEQLMFAPAVDVTNSKELSLAFDHVSTSTTQGKLRAFATGGSAADGAIEIAATHNLSTYVARFQAIGC